MLAQTGFELRRINPEAVKKDCCFLSNEQYEVKYKKLSLDGKTYYVPAYACHRPAVKNFLDGSLYEPDTHKFVKLFCKEMPGSMIHAGTFFGDMLPSFSHSVKGSVYAFEPVLENYILAKLCVQENSLTNVIMFNAALGPTLDTLSINTEEAGGLHAGGGSRIDTEGQASCTVLTIDSLNLQDLVLLQLDVEGFELSALQGAHNTIERCRPVIAIEDNNQNCDAFLKDNNYENMGQIPGLGIWCPKEMDEAKSIVRNFFSGFPKG